MSSSSSNSAAEEGPSLGPSGHTDTVRDQHSTAEPPPVAHAQQVVAATRVKEDPEVVAARDRLNALLDGIDSNKRKRDGEEDSAATVVTPYEWRKIFDPASKAYYYYNHRTGATQWERPAAFVEAPAAPSADYTAVASFSSKNGAFAADGSSSYWDQVGRANDREGRQMSAYFDMDTFEKNREDAKKKQEALKKSGIDWRKYKEEKKLKKQRLTNRWLYEDDA